MTSLTPAKNNVQPKYLAMPHSEAGQKIGLFGGSFNPPHHGHKLVSDTALTRLKLDQIWWIVTPGNPLKNDKNLLPLNERIEHCEQISCHPKVRVTAFEAAMPTRFTADTIKQVITRNSATNFVWIMGADNLVQFHLWQDWRWICSNIPICVVDRPGSTLSHLGAPASQVLRPWRLNESDAPLLATQKPPSWAFLHGPRSALSSSALRSNNSNA